MIAGWNVGEGGEADRTAYRRICAVGSLRLIAYMNDNLKIRCFAVAYNALLDGKPVDPTGFKMQINTFMARGGVQGFLCCFCFTP